jgi:hypothetical protein
MMAMHMASSFDCDKALRRRKKHLPISFVPPFLVVLFITCSHFIVCFYFLFFLSFFQIKKTRVQQQQQQKGQLKYMFRLKLSEGRGEIKKGGQKMRDCD